MGRAYTCALLVCSCKSQLPAVSTALASTTTCTTSLHWEKKLSWWVAKPEWQMSVSTLCLKPSNWSTKSLLWGILVNISSKWDSPQSSIWLHTLEEEGLLVVGTKKEKWRGVVPRKCYNFLLEFTCLPFFVLKVHVYHTLYLFALGLGPPDLLQ